MSESGINIRLWPDHMNLLQTSTTCYSSAHFYSGKTPGASKAGSKTEEQLAGLGLPILQQSKTNDRPLFRITTEVDEYLSG